MSNGTYLNDYEVQNLTRYMINAFTITIIQKKNHNTNSQDQLISFINLIETTHTQLNY